MTKKEQMKLLSSIVKSVKVIAGEVKKIKTTSSNGGVKGKEKQELSLEDQLSAANDQIKELEDEVKRLQDSEEESLLNTEDMGEDSGDVLAEVKKLFGEE